jgi:hypothetical protein
MSAILTYFVAIGIYSGTIARAPGFFDRGFRSLLRRAQNGALMGAKPYRDFAAEAKDQ